MIRLHLRLEYGQMQHTAPEDFLPLLALQFLLSVDEYPNTASRIYALNH